jgi:hypothetical protein
MAVRVRLGRPSAPVLAACPVALHPATRPRPPAEGLWAREGPPPLKLRIATKPSAALMRIYLEATSDWSELNSAGQEEVLLSGR